MAKSTQIPVERHRTIRLGLAVSCIVLRRSRAYMVAGLAAAALIAQGGAAHALASHNGPAKPLSCKQQYTAWRNGPARTVGQRLITDLTAIQSASTSGDIPQISFALRTLSSDSSALQRYPMPSCADPAGYWAQSLRYMGTSAARSAARPDAMPVMSPAVFMQKVQSLNTKLGAELARTTGIKG